MKFWKYIFIFLFLALSLLVLAVMQIPDQKLHLISCNVGQGDATLIIYKKTQILIDGGPDKKVLNCLGKYLPFWDREIELVILTHPDSDHFNGLIDVFKNYKVDNYLYNPIKVSKPEYEVLENLGGRLGQKLPYPHAGQVIRVELIQLDILSPQGDTIVTNKDGKDGNIVTDESTNRYSIVSLISFGKFKALITGDMPPDISDILAREWSWGSVNYIKVSHHGSKNGTTINLLKMVEPELAVISVGKNNYGQPAPEFLNILSDLKIKYLRTDKSGNIEVITNGETSEIVKGVQKN